MLCMHAVFKCPLLASQTMHHPSKSHLFSQFLRTPFYSTSLSPRASFFIRSAPSVCPPLGSDRTCYNYLPRIEAIPTYLPRQPLSVVSCVFSAAENGGCCCCNFAWASFLFFPLSLSFHKRNFSGDLLCAVMTHVRDHDAIWCTHVSVGYKIYHPVFCLQWCRQREET